MNGVRALFVGWADEGSPALLVRAVVLGFAALSTSLQGHAQTDTLYVRTLAANCAQCHGTDGHSAPGAAIPSLAGRSRDDLLAQLQAFKAGTRASTIMQQLAKGYSDTQLAQLATYFAARKP